MPAKLAENLQMAWKWLVRGYHVVMVYRFGPFELDTATVELRSAGTVHALEPQVFDLIALLVENRERMVSKEEIVEKVWDGRAVSDATLSSRIKSARQALGDDGKSQDYIRTVHGRGFRFVAAVVAHGGALIAVPSQADPSARSTRPSLAVLPFRQLGGDPRHPALGNALADELIAELARLRWLFVTARGSSFRFDPAKVDFTEAGSLLGVRYCLCGTLELSARRAAIAVELVDTADGGVVWAERLSGGIDDLHALREETRLRVLAALEVRVPLHEAEQAQARSPGDLDAWSAFHLGLQHMYRFNRADNAAAAAWFQRATQLAPDFARAHAGLSFVHFQNAFLRHSDDIAGEMLHARRCSERGYELDPLDPFVNFTLGRSYWLEGDLESSLGWLERATTLCPNYAQGMYARAWSESFSGRELQGREHVDLAMRLSPLDPMSYAMRATRAITHIAQGQDAEAAEWAERAARSPGAHVLVAMIAAVAHALHGDVAAAARWTANVRARNAALGLADFCRAFPIQPPDMRARVVGALARLGF